MQDATTAGGRGPDGGTSLPTARSRRYRAPMRRPILVVAAALVLAGCGGGTAAPTSTSSLPPAPAASSTGPAESPTAQPAGGAGCESLTRDDVARFALMAQLFPQIRDEGTLTPVRDGTLGAYSPEDYAAILAKLQFLRGREAPVGSPDESLDYYARVNDALAALLASGSPSTADFTAYQAVVGDVAASLTKQLGVNSALEEACPDLA